MSHTLKKNKKKKTSFICKREGEGRKGGEVTVIA